MKQDLNSKNINKNFKLMIISALVLVILFVYTDQSCCFNASLNSISFRINPRNKKSFRSNSTISSFGKARATRDTVG